MSPVRLPREIYLCAVIAFSVGLGFGVVGPALPILADHFGTGSTMVGMAISAMAFMRFASAVVNSRFVARLGEKRMLGLGLWLQGVSTLAAALAPSFEWLVVMRAVSGIGSSAFTIAAMSLVLRVAPRGRSGEAMGVFQSGFLMGSIAGPGIGGPLADLDPRAPFLLYAGVLIVAGVVAQVGLPTTPPGTTPVAGGPDDDTGGTSHLTGRAAALAVLACLAVQFGIGWLFYGVRNSTIPMYANDALGASGTFTGAALLGTAVAQVVSIRFFSRWSDTRGRRGPLLTGTVLGTGAVVLLAAVPGQAVFAVSMLLLGIAGGGIASGSMAVLSDVSQGADRARKVAWFNMAGDLGGITGPVAAGALADTAGFGAAFGVTAGMLGLGLLAVVAMPETMAPRLLAGAPPVPQQRAGGPPELTGAEAVPPRPAADATPD